MHRISTAHHLTPGRPLAYTGAAMDPDGVQHPQSPAPQRLRLTLSEAELRRGWRLHDNLDVIRLMRERGARVRILSAREAVVE